MQVGGLCALRAASLLIHGFHSEDDEKIEAVKVMQTYSKLEIQASRFGAHFLPESSEVGSCPVYRFPCTTAQNN